MYERLERSHDRVLGYEVAGELTEPEFEEALEEIEATIIKTDTVRLLVYAPESPPSSSTCSTRTSASGSPTDTFMEWTVKIEDQISEIEIQHFEEEELEDAWDWIEK